MPKKRDEDLGDLPLPTGWDVGRDYDGKLFYIDHQTKQTTWIDPRDRYTKPHSFADCQGDELPFGWEESYDPQIGVYYIDHNTQTNQLEDPRLQWRSQQEQMLKDYLVHAHEDLNTKQDILFVKQERYDIAKEELSNLNDRLANWKASRTSLNSTSSTGTKYDPDLLKSDVILAKKRVVRLKQELEQIRAEMTYQKQGVETLTQVKEKMTTEHNVYNVDEAQEIVHNINAIKQKLLSGERERHDLLHDLNKLYEDLSQSRAHYSPDGSTISIPMEKFSIASQTDLSGEYVLNGNQWGEMVRLRLKYDEAKKQVDELQQQLARIENQMIPGQNESDQDRLLLIQEKEQLLRELRSRSIKPKGKSEAELTNLKNRILSLEKDLQHAMEISNRQIAERLKLNEDKRLVLQRLAETTKMTTRLESELKSLSCSTLSVSSGSSRGSLGSLSASSKGSLNSLGMMDIYSQPQSNMDVNIQDLYRRVENLLCGNSSQSLTHSISPIHEVPLATGSAEDLYHKAMASSHSPSPNPIVHPQPVIPESVPMAPTIMANPESTHISLSPPVSPYNVGPPPSYQQHLQLKQQQSAAPLPVHVEQSQPPPLAEVEAEPTPVNHTPNNILAARRYVNLPETCGNPPLSPISESSSGVCNNLSGVNTRSVSAAVSDESVTGDSGVFEGTTVHSKRPGELDEVFDTSLECAQIQIKLKYDNENLEVGIEQMRNLAALAVPKNCEVCIKASLMPSQSGQTCTFRTECAKDLNCPRFHQIFRVPIEESRLSSKTLAVNVCSVRDQDYNEGIECLGSTQVSLASFDPKKPVWYNVLSFKFMETDSQQSMSSSRTSLAASANTEAEPTTTTPQITGNMVIQLLEASSAKLRRASIGTEEKSETNVLAESRVRSSSLDCSYFKSHPSMTVTSVKEESSDESTIISSQTSTLTRNQGPGEMEKHRGCSPDKGDCSIESHTDDEDDQHNSTLEKLPGSTHLQCLEDLSCSDSDEDDFSPDDTIQIVKCDKETNTETEVHRKHAKKRVEAQSSSSIRRSKTFSPANRVGHDYICKLTRCDSDSSVKYKGRGPFQRHASERRSVRGKKSPCLTQVSRSHTVSAADLCGLRTSLDLELDFQASKTRLSHLNDEITALRELKKKMQEAKATGEGELSAWIADNEKWLSLLQDVDRKVSRHSEEKADKKFRKAKKDVQRLRLKQGHNPGEDNFREKMAFFTSVKKVRVPIIPSELDSDFDDSTLTSTDSIVTVKAVETEHSDTRPAKQALKLDVFNCEGEFC